MSRIAITILNPANRKGEKKLSHVHSLCIPLWQAVRQCLDLQPLISLIRTACSDKHYKISHADFNSSVLRLGSIKNSTYSNMNSEEPN